jgi:hypothetical protein
MFRDLKWHLVCVLCEICLDLVFHMTCVEGVSSPDSVLIFCFTHLHSVPNPCQVLEFTAVTIFPHETVEMVVAFGMLGKGGRILCRKSDWMSVPDSLCMGWRLIVI